MSILVDQTTRLLVQGIAGRAGMFCAKRLLACQSPVVAGVTPGQGGTWVSGVPVFDTVKEAVGATDANASLLCVEPNQAAEAIMEAADAGLGLLICVTHHVPAWDMVQVRAYLEKKQVRLVGPGTPGVFSPEKCLAGIICQQILRPGTVGIVSRSGSLAYEATFLVSQAGLGQSTVVCIGSGLIVGTGFVDVLAMFEDDPVTEQVVVVGEIGGRQEEQAAEFLRDRMTKPVVAFIAGQTAPPGRQMGHAGAIIEGYANTAQLKMKALQDAGVRIATSVDQIPHLLDGGRVEQTM